MTRRLRPGLNLNTALAAQKIKVESAWSNISCHAEAKESLSLPIASTKADKLNTAPVLGANKNKRHWKLMYRWPAKTLMKGRSTIVASTNSAVSKTTRHIRPFSRKRFSGFCAEDPGFIESAR